ncbi:hypothetical protein SODALDRAFT_109243 [Sodiomyces alkalinus F11]|uniref:Uncharacterized protein n=1 Tax=Sodiomyces alkalinus (strain CBS 110278 / VKM F-3762 / F11) TaxID=1314773 RepID=A0A3N2Q2M6_SODAK|nr:hypothetical protein SODALDRAFT_109243 [Sodiomyces alkalinus F11]ROT40987.1 hypothetical protein SODALDRAFT_109243 [Sodiomyces alkalinus F11]
MFMDVWTEACLCFSPVELEDYEDDEDVVKGGLDGIGSIHAGSFEIIYRRTGDLIRELASGWTPLFLFFCALWKENVKTSGTEQDGRCIQGISSKAANSLSGLRQMSRYRHQLPALFTVAQALDLTDGIGHFIMHLFIARRVMFLQVRETRRQSMFKGYGLGVPPLMMLFSPFVFFIFSFYRFPSL